MWKMPDSLRGDVFLPHGGFISDVFFLLGMGVAAEEAAITGPDESRQGRQGVSCLAKVTNNWNCTLI